MDGALADGRWHDFATGDGGGDLVSLTAYLWGVHQSDAARDLARRLGLHLGALEGVPFDTGASEAQRQRLTAIRREAEQRAQQDAEDKRQRQRATALYWRVAATNSGALARGGRGPVLPVRWIKWAPLQKGVGAAHFFG
ncbi:hypothetical protein ACEOH9_10290 [Pseudomonas aeruginosa]